MSESRRSLNLLALVVALSAVGGVVWFLATLEGTTPPPPPDPRAEGGVADVLAGDTVEVSGQAALGRLRGTVFEVRHDAPVAGATVFARFGDREVTATADENGNFDLELPSGIAALHAEAPGLRNAGRDDDGMRLRVAGGNVLAGIQLFVYEPCTVLGTVYDDGVPAEVNVDVFFLRDSSGSTNYVAATAPTEHDGRFQAGGLPAGRFELRIETPGYAPLRAGPFDTYAGDIVDVGDLKVRVGATLVGEVRDAVSGAPIVGARLSAGDGQRPPRGGITDDSGRYAIYGVPVGAITVAVDANGYRPASQVVQTISGGEARADFALEAHQGIAIRVLTPNGEQVASARVEIWQPGTDAALRTLPYEGQDLYVPDLQGGPFTIEAHHATLGTRVTATASAGETVTMTLGAGVVVRGTVLRNDGNLASDARVQLLVVHSGGGERPWAPWSEADSGRFELQGVEPGTYRLVGSAQGHRDTRSDAIEVSGLSNVSLTLRLQSGGILYGTVLDNDTGAPISGATVGFEALDMRVQTGEDGFFQLSGFPEGRNTVIVRASGYRTALISGLEIGDGQRVERVVRLAPGAEDPRSLELVGVGLQLRDEGGRITILEPVESAAAARAGLSTGDAILAVDDVPVEELGFRQVLERIRGEEGTAVRLRVQRGDEPPFDVVVERQRVEFAPP